ncbi:MAG: hypothetical protein JO240_15035 [Solirubrobacterales bacterium]|nr:hypothetical protein [Solirubrobacterales bacterium]
MAGSALDYLSGSVHHLASLITIAVALESGFVGLCIAWGPSEQRRSYFWVRVALASLALPTFMAILVGVNQLLVLSDDVATTLLPFVFFLGVVVLMFVPALFYRGSGSSSGPSESDGGGGPWSPHSSPDLPRGGVPLLDADQASLRARDHTTPKFADLKRRHVREPGRTLTPTNE